MNRDTSEVIAEMRARATFLLDRGDDFLSVEADNMNEWADALEATIPAAEPADAGRDELADNGLQSRRDFVEQWRSCLAGDGHDVIANRNTVRRFVGIIDGLTRPPSEVATQPIMCGCHDETQRRLCVMRDKCSKPYAATAPQPENDDG